MTGPQRLGPALLAIERFLPPYRYDQEVVTGWVRAWLEEGGEEMLQPYEGGMRAIRISEPAVKPEKKERQGELFE